METPGLAALQFAWASFTSYLNVRKVEGGGAGILLSGVCSPITIATVQPGGTLSSHWGSCKKGAEAQRIVRRMKKIEQADASVIGTGINLVRGQ